MTYKWVSDNSNGMSSFTRVENPTPPKLCRVMREWGGLKVVYLTGLVKPIADAAAEGLNNLARSYGQADHYSVEEE